MDTFRHSARRRYDALTRLRTLTTGIAVTGIAATVGFGFAAAGGYRGTADQQAAGSSTTDQGATVAPRQEVVPFDDQQNGGFQPFQDNNAFQAPTRTRGSGHVSTGGS